MALYFFDSSALVKRYVRERGSVRVREVTASASGHLIHISLLELFLNKKEPSSTAQHRHQ